MTTKLIKAIYDDHFEEAHRLIAENQDDIINTPDEEGNFPLYLTIDHSSYDELTKHQIDELNKLALALIKAGANVNIDVQGMYPIHYSAFQKNASFDVFSALFDAGANLNEIDASGSTPLHYLIQKENWHIINYIVSNQKHIELLKNHEGKTPIDLIPAVQQNHKLSLLALCLSNTQPLSKNSNDTASLDINNTEEIDNPSFLTWLKNATRQTTEVYIDLEGVENNIDANRKLTK